MYFPSPYNTLPTDTLSVVTADFGTLFLPSGGIHTFTVHFCAAFTLAGASLLFLCYSWLHFYFSSYKNIWTLLDFLCHLEENLFFKASKSSHNAEVGIPSYKNLEFLHHLQFGLACIHSPHNLAYAFKFIFICLAKYLENLTAKSNYIKYIHHITYISSDVHYI